MYVAIVLCVFLAIQCRLALCLSIHCESDYEFALGSTGVSLTYELVGPHCPGTVRLVCEGVDLTFLRWRYNGDIKIGSVSFQPDSLSPIVYELQPPFISVELINVYQSLSMPRFANFSSVLIADFLQLQRDNVANISCGNAVVTCTLLIIMEEPFHEDPQINVNATQNLSNVLLEVLWERQSKQEEGCSEYEITLYTVTLLLNGANHTMTVNSSSCGEQCSVEFSISSLDRDENYSVYLQTMSSVGESNFVHSGTIVFIECSAPQPPLSGSVGSRLSSSPLGTTVPYQCDLYPNEVRMAVCSNVTGRGEWVPDPAELECKERTDNLCSTDGTMLFTELEDGSLKIENISNGVLVHIQCDDGYTLSGPSIITCTGTEGWSADPETVHCTGTATSLVIAIAAGVGGGCLTVVAVAVVVIIIVIKCTYSHYRKKVAEKPSSLPTTERDLADSEEVVFYEEIDPPSSKPLSYVAAGTPQVEKPTPTPNPNPLPTPWSTVHYGNVDVQAGASNHMYEEIKERRRQPVVTKDVLLKPNESYGMVLVRR